MFDDDRTDLDWEARDRQIFAYRRDMDYYTREAVLAVQRAVSALSALRSSQLFDPEYAEGDDGRDLSVLFEQVRRDLRSVYARQVVLNHD